MNVQKKRINAHLYVTSKCNLHCKHCYSANNVSSQQELSLAEMIMIVRTLCTAYDAYIDVEGGEIFLRNDILTFLKALTKYELSRITITTNGTIYPPIPPSLFSQLCEFRVSIEGHTDSMHHELRGIPLSLVIDNCINWLNQGVPVVARTTLSKANYKYIDELLEALISIGFKNFSFYEFQAVGRGNLFEQSFKLSLDELYVAIESLYKAVNKFPEIHMIKLHLAKPRKDELNLSAFINKNSPLLLEDLSYIPTVTVNHDGSVGICPWDIKSDNHLNIRKYPLVTLLEKSINPQDRRHECQYCSEMRLLYKNS